MSQDTTNIPVNTDDYHFLLDLDLDSAIPLMRDFVSTAEWHWVPNMMLAKNVSEIQPIIIDKLPWLGMLKEKFGGALNFYKTPSSAMYQWHQDSNIGCSLNMVMDEYHCHTLFALGKHPMDGSVGVQFYDKDGKYRHTRFNIMKHIEMPYKPGKFSIFNNQKPHCVINMGGERVMVTWVYRKPTTYEEVKNFYLTEIAGKV
jgi:hypothetical protein